MNKWDSDKENMISNYSIALSEREKKQWRIIAEKHGFKTVSSFLKELVNFHERNPNLLKQEYVPSGELGYGLRFSENNLNRVESIVNDLNTQLTNLQMRFNDEKSTREILQERLSQLENIQQDNIAFKILKDKGDNYNE